MKNYSLKGKAFMLFLFPFIFQVNAQTTLNYSTGFDGMAASTWLTDWTDDRFLFYVPYGYVDQSLRNYDSIVIFIFNKLDLSINKRVLSFKKINNEIVYGNKYQWYESKFYFFYIKLDNNGNKILSVNEINKDLEIERHIFSENFRKKELMQYGIINGEILIGTSKANDSLNLSLYDLNGNSLRSKYFNWTFEPSSVPVCASKYILEHPHTTNTILMKCPIGANTFVIDQIELDTIKVFDPDGPLNFDIVDRYSIFTLHNEELYAHDDYLASAGTTVHNPNWLTGGANDFQYFFMRQFWDGTYDIRLFGPKNIDNRAYAYDYNAIAGIHAIVGSVPFSSAAFHSQEQREVLLYVWDDYDVFDSIRLFGDKNHVPTNMIVDDNGDIFIAGIYNEPLPTAEAMVFLTKLPQFAIGIAKEKSDFPKIKLYPNPVTHYLQIENSTFSDGATIQIFNSMGQLQKSENLKANQIEVGSLSNGQYFIQITENKEVFNALFIKQ